MDEYLAFIDEIGRTIDGNYLYRFDFTYEPDIVWGEYFNVAPSIVIPNLQPDETCINKSGRVELKSKLNLAKRNGCFSMQDCFEHIISLGFTDVDNEEEIVFNFSEPYDEVLNKLHEHNSDLTDIVEKEYNKEEILDNLIETIGQTEKTNVIDDAINSVDEELYKEILTLEIGKDYKREEINKILFEGGYEKIDYIHKKAQYTIRGHIIDIFSLSFKYKHPFRISFFGDTIDDIYSFDIEEQTPIEHFEKIIIYKNNVE